MKGGVGKSSLALLSASVLHYDLGIPVTLVDCDDPQFTLVNMRRREAEYLKLNESATRRVAGFYDEFSGNQLDIQAYTPESLAADFDALLSDEMKDGYIIVDFPGRWSSSDLATLATRMNYVISPIEPVIHSLYASLAFADSLMDMVMMDEMKGRFDLKEIFFVWNKVRKNAPAHKRVMATFDELSTSTMTARMFDTILPDSVRFNKEFSKSPDGEFLLSTLIPSPKWIRKETKVDDFVAEIIKKCVK